MHFQKRLVMGTAFRTVATLSQKIKINSMYEVITLTASVHSINWKIRANYSFQQILANSIPCVCLCFVFSSSVIFLMDELRCGATNTNWLKHPSVVNVLKTYTHRAIRIQNTHWIGIIIIVMDSLRSCHAKQFQVLYCRLNSI